MQSKPRNNMSNRTGQRWICLPLVPSHVDEKTHGRLQEEFTSENARSTVGVMEVLYVYHESESWSEIPSGAREFRDELHVPFEPYKSPIKTTEALPQKANEPYATYVQGGALLGLGNLKLRWLDTRNSESWEATRNELPVENSTRMELSPQSPSARRAILPPSQKVLAINQALLKLRHWPSTPSQATAQVKEHLSEAKQEMLRSGRLQTGS